MATKKDNCSNGLKDVVAEVYMKESDGKVRYMSARSKIHRTSLDRGVLVRDGRQVVKQDGQWIYEVK